MAVTSADLTRIESGGLSPAEMERMGEGDLTLAEVQAYERYVAKKSEVARGGGFWSFEWLGGALEGGVKLYGKIFELQNQQEMMKLQQEIGQARLQAAMFGTTGPSAGGINTLTLLAFGGLAVFAIFMLTTKRI